jgi:hypothetical protein
MKGIETAEYFKRELPTKRREAARRVESAEFFTGASRPFPLAKQVTTCWSKCSKEETYDSPISGSSKSEELPVTE